MSQQQSHDPGASLPSPGSARASVPPLHRYYQGTPTPVAHPAVLRFLRLAVPREYAFFAPPAVAYSRGGPGVGQPVPRRPASVELTGSPKFLGNLDSRLPMFFDPGRPTSLRPLQGGRLAPAVAITRAPTMSAFRGSIAWLSGTPPTFHASGRPSPAQGWLPGAGQALLGGLSTRKAPAKGFLLTSCSLSSLPKLLGTQQHATQR
jgi:hypothetical protein